MKPFFILLFFCGMTVLAQEPNNTPEVKLTGFSHPESVIYDEGSEYFYVSNMADRTEGDGFISRISRKWKEQEHKWITGLNDPKGLLVKGDLLYVTDVTVLIEIDLMSGEVLRRIPVEGAKSLNDPALDENGDIYFSDLAGSSIYKMNEAGEIEQWLSSPDLERPNGLFVTPDFILVSAWGDDQNGNILKVDRSTKQISRISKEGIGNMDGIQPKANGEYFVSDWATGKIYAIDMDGNLEEVLTSEKSSGDILFLKEENKLYLPMNHQNELWIYNVD
ncbi:SMP-30/gluconolactonase/LRE family protein [Salinimicrobium xinjiangense]|uniref:SMP-30/gluconolactonase/LRE family protein n=1 Tax=Salinimicrobium xinjiangense TaxID=438596 RepID=UPI000416AA3A|nr:SMP-30/gluconolactonase/LRE family protein [Salinimicrobium xinjiangense]